jgi:hypothetical protein
VQTDDCVAVPVTKDDKPFHNIILLLGLGLQLHDIVSIQLFWGEARPNRLVKTMISAYGNLLLILEDANV